MAIVIVGDAEEVLPQARPFADTVEIFDTEGHMQDETKYVVGDSSELANVAGKWSVKIDFQGQSLPVTMSLEQTDTDVSGSLETMFGNGEISGGLVTGNKFTATAKAQFQGSGMNFEIAGKVEGDAMSGTISAPIVPGPLPFKAERA
jgi:hypothetical protein